MVSIKTNSYLKNVFTLMAGTIIGQGLVFLAAPIVFRLFSPAEITAMEQFVMVTTVLSVIVSGKYEFAIMHPREGEDARHILVLTLLVSAVMSTVIGFLGYFFRFELATILGDTLISAMLWALGPVLFFIAVSNTFNYWFSRQKQYNIAATAKVLAATSAEPIKIGVGFLNWGIFGLTAATLVGNGVSACYSIWKFFANEVKGLSGIDRNELKRQASLHKDYPLFSIWGSVLNRIAQWAHVGIFVAYYGPIGVAMMALCRRMVQAPLNVISNSYSQVFFQRISEIEDPFELRKLYYKVLFRFLFFAAILVVLIQCLPNSTMGFIFGDEWSESIFYLKWLSGWFALNFVSSSIAFITYRIQMQRVGTALDALHFLLAIAAVFVAKEMGYDSIEALKIFAVSKIIYFIFNLLIISWKVEKFVRRERRVRI